MADNQCDLVVLGGGSGGYAAALRAAGVRKPLIFRTYWSAAARMSWSVTSSAYGGRRVLMLRHIMAA